MRKQCSEMELVSTQGMIGKKAQADIFRLWLSLRKWENTTIRHDERRKTFDTNLSFAAAAAAAAAATTTTITTITTTTTTITTITTTTTTTVLTSNNNNNNLRSIYSHADNSPLNARGTVQTFLAE
jgi:hypothetical protein